jgi:membrane protease YdiL (CAAX protease family)
MRFPPLRKRTGAADLARSRSGISNPAVLFAAIHPPPVQAAGAAVSGTSLGWLIAASGNLVLPVLAHVSGNAPALRRTLRPPPPASLTPGAP